MGRGATVLQKARITEEILPYTGSTALIALDLFQGQSAECYATNLPGIAGGQPPSCSTRPRAEEIQRGKKSTDTCVRPQELQVSVRLPVNMSSDVI